VGGSNLINLPEKDPIFKDRVLIVDADTSIPKKATARGNTIKLPCTRGASGTDRSPENTIKNFLRSVADAPDGSLHDAMLRLSVTNPTSDKVLTAFFPDAIGDSNQREASKSWWVVHWNKLQKWGVIREWAACNKTAVDTFTKAFETAVSNTSKRLK
jgi:hypothetical protein